jgi:hypothetical protein
LLSGADTLRRIAEEFSRKMGDRRNFFRAQAGRTAVNDCKTRSYRPLIE